MRNYGVWMLAGGTVALLVRAAAPAAAVSRADRDFMTPIATMDTGGHAAEMAECKASRADVKDFRMPVKDDSESFGHLAELAAKTGVTIPRRINASSIATIQSLHAAKGTAFDRRFTRDEKQHALARSFKRVRAARVQCLLAAHPAYPPCHPRMGACGQHELGRPYRERCARALRAAHAAL